MAKITVDDSLSVSLQQLASLSDEERFSIIEPSAELLRDKLVEKIRSLFTQRSGALADSITARRRNPGGETVVNIYLKGKHPGSSTGRRKRKNGRSNGAYSGTNAEVGYILEYGSPRIKAKHWMETINEEQADAIQASQEAQWDRLLQSKGL